MTNTNNTVVGLYDAARANTTVKLHAAGCSMLNTVSKRVTLLDAEAIEDARSRGFKIVKCKCMSARLVSSTGHRGADGDGRVLHLRLGASVLCKTNGANRQATHAPKDVNCQKCLVIIKRICA